LNGISNCYDITSVYRDTFFPHPPDKFKKKAYKLHDKFTSIEYNYEMLIQMIFSSIDFYMQDDACIVQTVMITGLQLNEDY